MKKFLACVLGGLMTLGVFVTPVSSDVKEIDRVEVNDSKHVHVFLESFWSQDLLTLMQLTADLKEGDCLKITICSAGGNAFIAIAMVNHLEGLKARGVHIATESSGMTLSAGALVFMTGETRRANTGDLFMFHTAVVQGPYGPVAKEDLPKEAQWIFGEVDYYIRQYLLNILRDTELVNEILNKEGNKNTETNEHWYTAKEVFDLGIANKLDKTI